MSLTYLQRFKCQHSREAWQPGGCIYQAIFNATDNGKIIVKSFGNDYFDEDHDQYVDAFIKISQDRKMMGRVILVLNSEYSKNTDKLGRHSNRPEDHFRRAITAPGTDITTLTDINVFTTKSGTSMATPIVSGIIAQLLCDFRERRQFFIEHRLCTDEAFKGIILKGFLDNARKYGLNGEKLGPTFGQGIINYKNAYENIQQKLDAKFLEKKGQLKPQLISIEIEIKRKEIERELESRKAAKK